MIDITMKRPLSTPLTPNVNKYPILDIPDIVQRSAKYISCFDATGAYWQTKVKPDYQWLTGFVCDQEVFEWKRTPFAMKSSGSTFVREFSRF